ncbi:hypothetical protein [Globicatella sulfidifaciens]|uniref:Cthe-2314-like HEPN domain-containing protein n=1 Tax=Globicatella sulfidifaciens TaxID=136093 RepID=A0A7X8C5J4_9LACT|nr:hypothetical protein [Globicatella sulfidifaciens]NLJ19382.1 hypothetical protein [Globicatella sulfidifaciens]
MKDNQDLYVRSVVKFRKELDDMEILISKCVSDVLELEDSDLHLRAYRAEWHIKGLIYHCKNILEKYTTFAEEVMIRVTADEGRRLDILIMHSQEIQQLMYEFYALVNLSKRSLDNLSILVYPLFVNKDIPKSISDFKSGTTNCPMYERLANDPITDYLIDLRNCLVHFRTFATNDNAYVIKEGVNDDSVMDIAKDWVSPMAKAMFRYTEDTKIVVNIFLPDKIFDKNGNGDKKLAKFTYDNKFNLLGYSMRFTRTVMFSTLEGFSYLINSQEKFTYNKRGLGEKVMYTGFIS